MRIFVPSALLAMMLLLAACREARPQKVPFVPPLPPAKPTLTDEDLTARTAMPPPLSVPMAAPAVDFPEVDWPGPPPARRRVARQAARPDAKEDETASPETPQGPAPPAGAPQLSPLLSPQERQEYRDRIATSLVRTKQNLAALRSKRNLNHQQQGVMRRIEAFLEQAEQLQGQDPATASSLLERADLLAQDLLGRLR